MSTGRERETFVHGLAEALLRERPDQEVFAELIAAQLGFWPGWLNRLAFALAVDAHTALTAGLIWPDRVQALVHTIEEFLSAHPGALQELMYSPGGLSAPRSPLRPPLIHDWPIAPIATTPELAERLELSDGQLAWLADTRGLERTVTAERLRNYRYRWSPRRGGLERLIESPKLRLKEIQRWILREILDAIPPHPAAHGFTRGRSIHTHAAVHAGRPVVVRLDLRDFFVTVSAGRVHGVFATVGYPRPVAHVLTGLVTNRTPVAVLAAMARTPRADLLPARHLLQRRLATPHLPQGAPTSPTLANLVALRLDRRLTGLARTFGLSYSRYADDLTFSGSAGRRATADLCALIIRIAREEGFSVNPDKTMIRSRAQRQLVTGLVVNDGPRTPRDAYDRLRAQLHRLARSGPIDPAGPDGTDLRARLQGQIAWVAQVTPGRGEKLRRMGDAIEWIER